MGQTPTRFSSEHPIQSPTKIGSKMGGEFTNPPKWDPIDFDPQLSCSVTLESERKGTFLWEDQIFSGAATKKSWKRIGATEQLRQPWRFSSGSPPRTPDPQPPTRLA